MNPGSEKILAEHQGFQIILRDGGLLFVDKNTRGPAIATFVLFGLSAICALAAVSVLAIGLGDAAGRGQLVAVLPIGLIAVVTALAGRFAYRAYRARATGPGERLVVDGTGQALKTSDGTQLAPLSQVSAVTNLDLTDGMGGFRFARVLSLRWPGGKRAIFKSYDQGELTRLRSELAKFGIR